jgi:16S rRNA G966 N2-methylase RsmD
LVDNNKNSEIEWLETVFNSASNEVSIQFLSMWDAFAKEGNILSKHIASKFKQVDAVDINDYAEDYKKNTRHENAEFFVMDNRNYISKCEKTYDLILMDNPMCEIDEYTAEHFGVIDGIVPLTKAIGNTILIFNTSLEPYDYEIEGNRNWQTLRNKFYGKENTSMLRRQFLIPFYINYLQDLGLNVLFYDRFARRSTEEGDRTSIDLNFVVVKRKK